MLHIRRLAQAGFVLSGEGTRLVVDAFLSPRADRLVPPAVSPESLAGPDAILATHEHGDHLDLPSLGRLAAASPEARVIVPAPIVDRVRSANGGETVAGAAVSRDRAAAERVTGALVDRQIAVGAARVVPIPAMHGVTMADAYGFGRDLSDGLYRFLGYVIELGGVRVYHAGDTIRYDGMAERLRELRVDLALVPINGRSAEREARGLVGNLSHSEAADLVADARIPALVPMHYDTIAGNTGSVDELRAYVRERRPVLTVVEMAPFSERSWPLA